MTTIRAVCNLMMSVGTVPVASTAGMAAQRMKNHVRLACFFMCLLGVVRAAYAEVLRPRDRVDVDVLVVGAGSAGVPAAVQAGRLGAKTVLVEASGILGGNLTLGGVEHPDPFRKNGRTVIGGIGLEWTMKTVALGRGAAAATRAARPLEPDRLTLKENFDPWTFVCVGEELLRDAGVDLRYYEMPVKVEKLAGPDFNWRVLTGVQGGLREIRCRELVDATGNGGLAELCGAAFLPVDGEVQGGSLHYCLTGVPRPGDLPRGLLARRLAEAYASGALRDGDNHGGDVGDEQILRWQASNYIYGADNTTSEARTETNVRGRASALRVLRFVRTLPGGATARIAWMSPETGVRETRRVKGRVVVTGDDYLSGRCWEDAVCYATYQIDMHMHRWKDFVRVPLGHDVYPTVPYRALLPAGVEHLLVAGRCLSADRRAFAALRLCAPAMATGQAAGVASALAARTRVAPSALDVGTLKKVLAEHGQIVPEPGLF